MEYSKEIVKKDRIEKVGNSLSHKKDYRLIKEYPNFALYENKYGYKECFSKFDVK